MWNKKRFFLIYLLSISLVACCQINFQIQNYHNKNLVACEAAIPKISQLGSNITLSIIKPELSIIEGHVVINISTETSGTIQYALTEQSGDQYFVKINQSIGIIGNNQSQLITMRIIPLITTFPGEYHFILNITGLFIYSETFNMFLGMGYSLFTISLAFVAIIVVIAVLKHKNNNKVKKAKGTTLSQTNMSSQSVLPGKISCPNCRKMIEEGLSFCPECGDRIPEFLRYNPK